MGSLDELQDYYRRSLAPRIEALESVRSDVAELDAGTVREVRELAHTLRGSGATYGFPEVTEAAGALEDASDAELAARVDGLLDVLRGVAAGQEP